MDPIANMLSAIKNSYMVGKPFIEIPYSKQREQVAKVLEKRGFLAKIKVFNPKDAPYKGLHLDLAYDETKVPSLNEIMRVSRPGRRLYMKASELRPVKSGYGLLVVSTPRGMMSGEDARKKKLGGEVICKVW